MGAFHISFGLPWENYFAYARLPAADRQNENIVRAALALNTNQTQGFIRNAYLAASNIIATRRNKSGSRLTQKQRLDSDENPTNTVFMHQLGLLSTRACTILTDRMREMNVTPANLDSIPGDRFLWGDHPLIPAMARKSAVLLEIALMVDAWAQQYNMRLVRSQAAMVISNAGVDASLVKRDARILFRGDERMAGLNESDIENLFARRAGTDLAAYAHDLLRKGGMEPLPVQYLVGHHTLRPCPEKRAP
jgi:hypothetical protein